MKWEIKKMLKPNPFWKWLFPRIEPKIEWEEAFPWP